MSKRKEDGMPFYIFMLFGLSMMVFGMSIGISIAQSTQHNQIDPEVSEKIHITETVTVTKTISVQSSEGIRLTPGVTDFIVRGG